jgi:nucleoside phosphorylase
MVLLSGLASFTVAVTLSGQAAPAAQQRPEMLERLAACRTIADSAARLGCYDGAAAALDTAQRQGDLVVMDRAAVNETRRDLFGFNMPALPRLFGTDAPAELDSIETTLQSASRTGDGHWVFRLADGGVWRQIDSDPLRFDNQAGQAVRVRKASLGSFMMTVGDSRAVRVRRQ